VEYEQGIVARLVACWARAKPFSQGTSAARLQRGHVKEWRSPGPAGGERLAPRRVAGGMRLVMNQSSE